ncbi:GntR family transcriptional regulator [Roseibium litorale]|uniref:GntR family transcriptional regulator n=1 Tax=Roseibium litorale TaxID=2803841 RepID=A0ABR9CMS8_9HYPH|nr:GntR family transcriptional regulator [Roseibium litorale]MBD8892174.1 GntR family transcriptional regulator [Roseibium litorale]
MSGEAEVEQGVNRKGRSGSGADISLRQVAYGRIEALLNAGTLLPGQIISQRELVEMTGTTLGAVREAIPRFEAEGLLVTLPQRGLMVPSLDVSFIRDAYQMRLILETAAVPDVVRHVERKQIADWLDWHLCARQQIENGEAADSLPQDLQYRDWDIHSEIIHATGNQLMANVYRVNAIKIRMTVQTRIRVTQQNAQRVIGEHIAFLEPLLAGDVPNAQEALGRHIASSLRHALGTA